MQAYIYIYTQYRSRHCHCCLGRRRCDSLRCARPKACALSQKSKMLLIIQFWWLYLLWVLRVR